MIRFDFCCRCGIEYSVLTGRQACRCGVVHYLGISEQQYESQKSRGLGDTIAKITKAFGISPCGGCDKRREKLNQLVPYKTETE